MKRASAAPAVTLIQRFGSALNVNIRFHILWFDGVYEENVKQPQCKPRLHRARAPTSAQLTALAGKIANRVCRHLARKAGSKVRATPRSCRTAPAATTAWTRCG